MAKTFLLSALTVAKLNAPPFHANAAENVGLYDIAIKKQCMLRCTASTHRDKVQMTFTGESGYAGGKLHSKSASMKHSEPWNRTRYRLNLGRAARRQGSLALRPAVRKLTLQTADPGATAVEHRSMPTD